MGNPLKTRQWFATVLIFAALFADILFGRKYIWGPKPDDIKINPNKNVEDVEKAENAQYEVEMEKLNKDGQKVVEKSEKENLKNVE